MSNSYNTNYTFANQDEASISNGSCLQGSITASFDDLEQLLGKPVFEGKGDKITTEFVVKWQDLENDESGIFTLYDWCFSRHFGCPYEQIVWNVGGNSYNDSMAADALLERLV